MRESKIERGVCRDAKQLLGVDNIKLKMAGFPDRMFFIPGGKPLLIEFKAPGEVPGPLQLYIIELLLSIGYIVEFHDDYERAFQAIIQAMEAAQISNKGS